MSALSADIVIFLADKHSKPFGCYIFSSVPRGTTYWRLMRLYRFSLSFFLADIVNFAEIVSSDYFFLAAVASAARLFPSRVASRLGRASCALSCGVGIISAFD